MKRTTVRLSLLAAIAALFLLSLGGCQNVASFHVGGKVPSADSVPLLTGGPHQGTWDSFEIIIPYTYEQRGSTLDISADCRLGPHYQSLYNRLSRLDLYLYFVDESNTVLATSLLTSAYRQTTDETITFRRTLAIPSGTEGFSFGYQGAVSELEDYFMFYKQPYR